jgi:hypothetical protein
MNAIEHPCGESRVRSEDWEDFVMDRSELTRVAAATGLSLEPDPGSEEFILLLILAALSSNVLIAEDMAERAIALAEPPARRLIRRYIHSHTQALTRHLAHFYREFPQAGQSAEAVARGALWNAIIANHLSFDQ